MKQTPSISILPVATNVTEELNKITGVPSAIALGFILGLVKSCRGFMPIAERKALQDALHRVRGIVEQSAGNDNEANDRVMNAIDAALDFIEDLPEGLPEQTLRIADLPDTGVRKTLRLNDRGVAAKVEAVIAGSVTKKVPLAHASA